MANFAAVDCGTMSTRLLVSGADGEPLVRLTRITALGEGVDASRTLLPQAVQRTVAVLAEYREVMDRYEVGTARMIGTSALRDASNRESFFRAAEDVIGTSVVLLSGDEEASLSYLGATSELNGVPGHWLVADIGGGSTELVVGRAPLAARSLELGCVRVTERFLHHDPPAPEELAAAAVRG